MRIKMFSLLTISFLLLTACGEEPPPDTENSLTTITVVDDAGRELTFAEPPMRVISTAPDATELVSVLAPGRLVARSVWCNYPPAIEKLPVIGDFSNPDAERIAALEPDLVLLTGLEQAPLLAKLENLGIPAYVYYPTSLAALRRDFIELGRLFENIDGGEALALELDAAMLFDADKDADKSPGVRPIVYAEISAEPLMTVAEGSLLHELIVQAGGENPFADLPREYHEVTPEQLLLTNPDVVLIICGFVSLDEVLERTGWSELAAVQNGQVYQLDSDLFTRAGPRTATALRQLHELLVGVN